MIFASFASCGNIASGYILLPHEAAQHYPTTFKIVMGVMCATIFLALLLAAVMWRENRVRDCLGDAEETSQVDLPIKEVDKEEIEDQTDGQNIHFRYLC